MNSRKDTPFWNFIDIGLSIAVPIIAAIVGWIAGSIYDHAQRISAIESSRYTASEAKEDQKILTKAIGDIKDSLHTIDKKATELTGSVRDIKQDVLELKAR